MNLDPRDTQDALDTTLMGPGFFVFFQRGIIESGGFNFPDRPPVYKDVPEKVCKIIKRIEKKQLPKDDEELALRLALKLQEIKYQELYLEILQQESKRRKRRCKAIILLLTGDG